MESEVGMELFFTDTEGIDGRLKKYPEDFQVEEIIDLGTLKEGDYSIAKIWARNWETNRLIIELAKRLNIDRRDISFSGTKDKRAVTTQYMSFKTDPDSLKEVEINNVEIRDINRSHKSLHLGAHKSNRFGITIRDISIDSEDVVERVEQTAEIIKKEGGFPNWFGIQRFGSIRPITHIVGKHIITGKFEKAVRTYLTEPDERESQRNYEARKFLQDTWDYEEALERYSKALNFERDILRSLIRYPDDPIKALKKLPQNLRLMFIHAYQSYLFNKMVSERLRRGIPLNDARVGDILLPTDRNGLPNKDTPVEVTEKNVEKASKMVREGKAYISAPLLGRSSRFSNGVQGEIEREVVSEEDIDKKDFVIPELPEISSTGSRREMFAKAKDLEWEEGESSIDLRFELFKGTYATTLLREFMKLPDTEVHRYS